MISAAEARQKAQNCISEKDQEMLNKIEGAVARAINNGDFSCWVDGYASGRVIAELQKLGYKAKQSCSQRDGNCIQIEW